MRIMIVLAALALGACTGTANVYTPTVPVPQGMTQLPGKYAVLLQTGGWQLTTETEGFTCSLWDFDTGIDNAYANAMKQTLPKALEEVAYIGSPLNPADLQAEGYDAQIVLHQGNATSNFGIEQGWFSGTAKGAVEIEVILAVSSPTTQQPYQQTVTGKGLGSKGALMCDEVGDAIGLASQDALTDLIDRILLYVRDGVGTVREPRATADAGV